MDINQLFHLDLLNPSKTSFVPFEEVRIEWQISPRDSDTLFADYKFTLVETEGVIVEGIPPTGSITFNPHKSTLVRVQGQRLGGGAATTLGDGLSLTADEGDCRVVTIPQASFDDLVLQRLTRLTASSAEIRLRSHIEQTPTGPVNVQDEIEATWAIAAIRYYFPLEIDINNFFNADLDLNLEISFSVRHGNTESELEANVSIIGDVDFDTVEDVLSLGSSTQIASGIEKLLPLVFDFDGLSALVTAGLQRDPLSGDAFIFVSRDRVRAKVLHWDGTGLCVYAKRLERGRCARVWREAGDAPITLTVSELDLFVDGSTLVGRVALSPPPVTQFLLASIPDQ